MAGKTPKRPVFPHEETPRRRTPPPPVFDERNTGAARRSAPAPIDYGAQRGRSARRSSPDRLDFTYRASSGAQGAARSAPNTPAPAQGANRAPQNTAAARSAPPMSAQAQSRRPAGGGQRTDAPRRAQGAGRSAPERLGEQGRGVQNRGAQNRRPPAGQAQKNAAPPRAPKRKKRAPQPPRESAWARFWRLRREKKQNAPPLTPEQVRRRRIAKRAGLALLIAALVAACALGASVFLFRIQTVRVEQPEGGTAYSDEQIAAAFGEPLGGNLFGFSAQQAQQRIEKALPYLENVTIERRLPDEVLIRVQPAEEAWRVQTQEGAWAVVSRKGKVLALAAQEPDKPAARITGALAKNAVPGEALALDSVEKLSALQTIVAALEQTGLAPVTEIDLTDTLELNVLYDGRVRIVLGTANDMAYKVDWAWRLATPQTEDSLSDTDTGILDVSSRSDEGRGKATFRAGSTEVTHVARTDASSAAAGGDSTSASSASGDASSASSGALAA